MSVPVITLSVHRSQRGRRRGLGLAELLISLAISASLLTAVAVATHASFVAYGATQVQSDTTQRARLTIDRILASIRITDAHAPLTAAQRTEFASGQIVEDSGLVMFDAAGDEIHWQFDAAAGELHLVTTGGTFVMLREVRDFRVTFEPMKSPQSLRVGGSFDLLARATILLTVGVPLDSKGINSSSREQTFTLSASVVPRRNVGL